METFGIKTSMYTPVTLESGAVLCNMQILLWQALSNSRNYLTIAVCTDVRLCIEQIGKSRENDANSISRAEKLRFDFVSAKSGRLIKFRKSLKIYRTFSCTIHNLTAKRFPFSRNFHRTGKKFHIRGALSRHKPIRISRLLLDASRIRSMANANICHQIK